MRIFRWLVVVTVVMGAIIGGAVPYLLFFTPAGSVASSDGTSGSVASSQLTGHSVSAFVSALAFLALEIVALMVALLSGVMYSVSGRRRWQIVLWGAAIVLLLQSALVAFSSFTIIPGLPPAASLMLLAALFSLGVRQTPGDADVERQPLMPPVLMAVSQERTRLILGTVVALLGGVAVTFLMPVSLVAILIALGVSSIGATLLIRSPLSALVVPAAIWLGAIAAVLYKTASDTALGYPIFWGGIVEFAAILIVIAVIPALSGVAIGALLTRWIPGASA
ncbi:MAG TPA: hypothetical protein VH349_08660 [Ktedonobacterales bacterium]|jgi:hypothetical protein